MGKDKRHNKGAGYKPVECQELQKEINGNVEALPPNPVKSPNSFHLVGNARLSKTGQSLSIKLNPDEHYQHSRYLTILKTDIIALFSDESNLSVATVREYDNPPEPKKVILTNI